MGDWVLAGKASDISGPRPHIVDVRGEKVALYKVDGEVLASAGLCPHEGECLVSGYVDSGTVECALHYAVFELATGALVAGPATGPLPVYPVKCDGDHIYVWL